MEGDEENVASSSPQVEMRYYVDPARPLMGVVRAIGVMALLFGILSLVTLPLNLMYDRSQRSASPQGNRM